MNNKEEELSLASPDYVFDKKIQNKMESIFLGIKKSPFFEYIEFKQEVQDIVKKNEEIFKEFIEICEEIKNKSRYTKPFWYLENAPIDPELPIFGNSDPVESKYKEKTTFVAESFLEAFSQMTDTPLLGYETRNNGDFFHDIYPQERYDLTQTQKTYGELHFHNDRTAHAVRSDYLNLLGLRSDKCNKVLTGYMDGGNILELLDKETQEILRKPYFITPFDNLSRDCNLSHILSEEHAILENVNTFRFYLNRTSANPKYPIAKKALEVLNNSIERAKRVYVYLQPGSFISFPNLNGLHNKQFFEIQDYDKLKERWILKTYNFATTDVMNEYDSYFYADMPGKVKETREG